ncbi:hypothetical protein E2978_04295 (plasmid) [Paracoccus yeei]
MAIILAMSIHETRLTIFVVHPAARKARFAGRAKACDARTCPSDTTDSPRRRLPIDAFRCLTGFGDKSEQGVEMQRFPSAIVAAMLSTVAVGADAEPIKLGSKAFIENILVAEITKQYLEAKGLEADLRSGLGSTVIREAIVSRQIDLY